MRNHDPKALQVARSIQQSEQAELTILFGSRARGDHNELKSDIDVLLVQAAEPGNDQKRRADQAASAAAQKAYGHEVTVQLVWRTLQDFRHNRRYVNSVETHAVQDGAIMPRDPSQYDSSHYKDEDTGYEHDWRIYDERLEHAVTHLDEFIYLVEGGRSDLAIEQHAQGALEHGLKAILEAHGSPYRNTHDTGELLGNVRHRDAEMRNYRLSIPPEVYSEYAGRAGYTTARSQPRLTGLPGYLEQTVADAGYIIARAEALRAQA